MAAIVIPPPLVVAVVVFAALEALTQKLILDANVPIQAIEPIDVTNPESSARPVDAHEVNRVAPGTGRRESIAIPRASVTSAAVWQASMDQPTTRHVHPAVRLPMLRHAETPPALVARTSSV